MLLYARCFGFYKVLGFGDDKSKISYWGLNHMLLHISV